MSRNLQTSSSRASLRAPTTPSKARASTPTKIRAQPPKPSTPTKASARTAIASPDPASAPLSIREAIALRRAEAKKAQMMPKSHIQEDFGSLEDASPVPTSQPEEEDILGRLPVRETLERARSTGSLNLATRSLPCIPSALFEIHLGITPDRLKSVPNEPILPPSAPADIPRRGKRDNPAWFEAQDLQVLKIWNNEIQEIQHEISLFGSLKTVDLHKNKIPTLPTTFADLTALTSLDLSHNCLTSLPPNIFTLPELSNLNVSHNSLISIPFNSPFANSNGARKQQSTGGSFFAPAITRATAPLPRLLLLDASHNKITAGSIDPQIPKTLNKLDLSANPLETDGPECRSLFRALGDLPKLKELRLKNADVSDALFSSDLFSSAPFPSLRLLDMEETKVTPEATRGALAGMKQQLDFDLMSEDPPEGTTSIILGKRIIKEAWEIEMERKAKSRKAAQTSDFEDWDIQSRPTQTNPTPESKPAGTARRSVTPPKPREVMKEDWEIEAEQGMLTEGAKRRARAAATAGSKNVKQSAQLGVGSPPTSAGSLSANVNVSGSLASPQYYDKSTSTLTLPPSTPSRAPAAHLRHFSMSVSPAAAAAAASRSTDLAVPAPTLPLSVIVAQPFAHTLKVLILVNRRLDKSFVIPPEDYGALLPALEELDLEGCGLVDLVPVTRSDATTGAVTPPRSPERILPMIAKLFPSLQTLNLSGNALTSAAFPADALSDIILGTAERKGLKHLRIRGNRITELQGFQTLAELFKGNRQVPGWHLDELDIRDNEIGKLPPETGLLPMDVFLVDGNTFRVPARRVWEREGTKGLLSWLRGRIE